MPSRYHDTPAARRIDEALRRSTMSAKEAAEAIGVRPNVLSMVRTGALPLPPRRCGRFAEVLGIGFAELMDAGIRSYPDNRSWDAAGLSAGSPSA